MQTQMKLVGDTLRTAACLVLVSLIVGCRQDDGSPVVDEINPSNTAKVTAQAKIQWFDPVERPITAEQPKANEDQARATQPTDKTTLVQPQLIKQKNNQQQAGTDFDKVDEAGVILPSTASHWACALDRHSGLLWEIKLFDGGVSDVEHSYSWFNPASATPGKPGGGQCYGIECDTAAYVREINRIELCGRDDWRLPVFSELSGLIDRDYYDPTLNQLFFPHARGTIYWTSTELSNNPKMVMQVDFFNGISYAVPKSQAYSVRLVSRWGASVSPRPSESAIE